MISFESFLETFEDELHNQIGKWKDDSPEYKASIKMMKELESVPKAPSWKGNPTWDFGNGVYVSMTNMPRNVASDNLFGFMRPKSQPPNIWYVEFIQSQEKGKGYASAALKEVIDMADRSGVSLRLYPHKMGRGKELLNDKQLTAWYSKYGFLPIGLLKGKSLYLERKPKSS